MYKLMIILVLLVTQGGSGLANEGIIKGYVKDGVTLDDLSGVVVYNKSLKQVTQTNEVGYFKIKANKHDELLFTKDGYNTINLKIVDSKSIKINLMPLIEGISYISTLSLVQNSNMRSERKIRSGGIIPAVQHAESYRGFSENKFIAPAQEPFSTFAIDVDGASYSNVRRMINAGELPPKDAVRIEEMINYFSYDHFQNVNKEPVKISTELTNSPWNKAHQLMRIVLKAKDIPTDNLPPANFVFLIDVSGSMQGDGRLPLVKSSLKLLIDQLREEDQVAIVTYAGQAGVKLNSIKANQKMTIKQAIDELNAGGSTAGGEGIMM
ncbi:MAG: VWA domain-containing protein, partial [Sphingobacterium sp.]